MSEHREVEGPVHPSSHDPSGSSSPTSVRHAVADPRPPQGDDDDDIETEAERRDWERLLADPESVDMTREQLLEVRRRLNHLRRNPGDTIPWETVSALIDDRLSREAR